MSADPGPESAHVHNLLPASLLLRCGAIAVDMCVTVAASTLGMALIAFFTPVDSASAQSALALLFLAAVVYVAWGRNRFPSIGRRVFRLQFARVATANARQGRPVTVHMDPQPVHGVREVALAGMVIIACIAFTLLSLREVISTTQVFVVVQTEARALQPLAARYGTPPRLADFPNALLIGEQRAYVQVDAHWAEVAGTLDWFLIRHQGNWQVEAVHEAKERRFARYALKAPKSDIPKAPQP